MSRLAWIILILGVLAIVTTILIMKKRCASKCGKQEVLIDELGNEIPVSIVNTENGRVALDSSGQIVASDSGIGGGIVLKDSDVGGGSTFMTRRDCIEKGGSYNSATGHCALFR